MTVSDAIKHPDATPNLLAVITAGFWARNWIDGAFAGTTYKVATDLNITSVEWNGTALALRDIADLDVNPGSYSISGGYLHVHGPATASPHANTVQAFATFYFATGDKTLNDQFYDGRLLSAPNLSSRIEEEFGGVGQTGGGNLILSNSDSYFDDKTALQWNAGTVTLELGVDTPQQPATWAQYQTVATWLIEDWARTNSEFSLKLKEPKAKLAAKIPLTTYSRSDYPNIEEKWVGKAIPIAYGKCLGIEPQCIDIGAKKFKVAGHAVKSFDGVRVRVPTESFRDITTAAADWMLYSSDTYRYYLIGEEGTNVNFGSSGLTRRNSIASVVANNGSWAAHENYVYVNPDPGETISSGVYTITAKKSVSAFVTANFATTNVTLGEFTLGDSYQVGTGVSVDFTGKASSGVAILNAAEIVEDLLTTVGETNLNTSAFATAEARLKIGIDEGGTSVSVRNPTLYLNEPRALVDILSDINKHVGSYIYSDETGQYYYGVFQPERSENLSKLDDYDILAFKELVETRSIVSKVSVSYAERVQDGFSQLLTVENSALQTVNNQPTAATIEQELAFESEADARYWAQRKLITNGLGVRKYEITTKWQGLLFKPGQQLHVTYAARNLDAVLEILEVRIDYKSKDVSLVLGNLRGFGDTPGFWVADADTLPTRFSNLTGYGSGSLAWNASWHADIKDWARKNVGYWTDANGFANSSDPESFIPSAWV